MAVLDQIDSIGILGDIVAIARDDCLLRRGDIAAASRNPPLSRSDSTFHPFLDQRAWAVLEDARWQILADDPAMAGQFEIVWPDGTLENFAHETPESQLATADFSGLNLIVADLIIGPAGHVLRPHTYHTSAEYPWASDVVVAAQKRALRLRPRSTARSALPVLVLEGFEDLRWRNYYHWMIPILSRVALAQERGVLKDRYLVVPDGLSGWIKKTLSLIGLPPDRQIVVPLARSCTLTMQC